MREKDRENGMTPSSKTRPWMSSRGWLLTRAFLAWGLFSVLGFLPEFFFQLYHSIDRVFEPIADQPQSAWAGFTHFAGFSVFLFMITKKKRWLVIPIICTVWWMWIWRWFHIPPEWWAFATHTLGYILMVVSLLMVMGVLSGLAYLWVELLAFLRNLYVFYPQVKEELRSHPLLEAVIVSTSSSNSPSTTSTNGSKSDALKKIVNVHKEDNSAHCFLCKQSAVAYVEVCKEWTPSSTGQSNNPSLSICTPFAVLKESHRRLEERLQKETALTAQLKKRLDDELHEKVKWQHEFFGHHIGPTTIASSSSSSSSSSAAVVPVVPVAATISTAAASSSQVVVSNNPPSKPSGKGGVVRFVEGDDEKALQKKDREVRHLLSVIDALEQTLQSKEDELKTFQDQLTQCQSFMQSESTQCQQLKLQIDTMERERRLMTWVANKVTPFYY